MEKENINRINVKGKKIAESSLLISVEYHLRNWFHANATYEQQQQKHDKHRYEV